MTFYNKIREIEIENSGICNAACPQCVRETTPGDHSWFEEKYLDVDFFQNRIPDHVYADLEMIRLAGTIGDPCAAPNFIEVCKTLKTKGAFQIHVSTNGGMKNSEWWKKLAQVLGPDDIVQFAFDGLENTNHIYRVNVNWHKAIKNAKAFIDAGGNANWQYIVFRHNQHQVEEAKTLANSLGFKNFIVKPSHRFFLDELLGVQRFGSGGVLIEPPTEEKLIHKIVLQTKPKPLDMRTWCAKSENTCIECYAQKDRATYIDYLGQLWPCCYLGAGLWVRHGRKYPDGWDALWESTGGKHINLHLENWDTIITGKFFEGIASSWNKDYSNGRLITCAGVCSAFDGRYNDPAEFDKLEVTKLT
jgi:MoaA/NifB/PqqE/SkfB family radical SAM enzyme